jgi:hypothetical protein
MVTIKTVTYRYSNRDETSTSIKFDNYENEFAINKILKFTGNVLETLNSYWFKRDNKESCV